MFNLASLRHGIVVGFLLLFRESIAADCDALSCVEDQSVHLLQAARARLPVEGRGRASSQELERVTAQVLPVNQESPTLPVGKVATALCFSGGGARSLAASMGQLRALHSLGLASKVDLISSVSGGSWGAAIYMFAKGLDDTELLGAPTHPGSLTLEELSKNRAAMSKSAVVDPIKHAVDLLLQQVPMHKVWTRTIAEFVLGPLGLGDLNSSMAASEADVSRIKALNPEIESLRFLTPRAGRPKSFVMNGALRAPDATASQVVGFRMQPDFIGSIFYNHSISSAFQNPIVGGGMVESFAFGGESPWPAWQQSGDRAAQVGRPEEPFSLSTAVAVSSAAFTLTVSELAANLGHSVPDKIDIMARYWPVTSREFPPPAPATTCTLGDGGEIDNYGIAAALQSGARRLVAFLNTYQPINETVHWCTGFAGRDVEAFQQQVREQPPLLDLFGHGFDDALGGYVYSRNHIFPEDQLFPLMCALLTERIAGRPSAAMRELPVLRNDFWGLEGGFNVKLLVVYNQRLADFESALPEVTREALAAGVFGSFPYYSTYEPISMPQVNLIAAQTEYVVLQNFTLFEETLSH